MYGGILRGRRYSTDALPPGATKGPDGEVYLTPSPVPASEAPTVASSDKPTPSISRVPSSKPVGTKAPSVVKESPESTGDSEVDALTKASQEEGNYYKELLKRYDQAVTQRDKDISLANLQEAAAQIMMRDTSGGRDVEYYKGLRSRAGTGITDFEKRKELEQEARDADPTSAESQSYRQLLKEQGIKLPDSVSAAFIKKQYPQFANIVSIEKVDGKTVASGSATEVQLENVFWDSENGIVSLSEEDSAVSPVDGSQMQNIGFVEKNDTDKKDMIKFLVDSAKGIKTIKMTKEDTMSEDTNEVVEVTETDTTPEVTETEVAPEAKLLPEIKIRAPPDVTSCDGDTAVIIGNKLFV